MSTGSVRLAASTEEVSEMARPRAKVVRMRFSLKQPSGTEPLPNVRFDGGDADSELCVLVIRGRLWARLGEPQEIAVRVERS